MTTKPSFSLS